MLKLLENGIYTNGKEYITGNYLNNTFKTEEEKAKYQQIEYWDLPGGTTIRCFYDEIFYDDSSLLLCNNITEVDEYLFDNIEHGSLYRYFDENGDEVDEDDDYVEEQIIDIYQYFLIDNSTAEMLMRHTDEIIFYSEKLDLYVLGVTHFGTMWCGVGTDFIK